MPLLSNRAEFPDFLRNAVKRLAKVKDDPKSQFDLETALNRQLILQSSETKQLVDELIAAQLDPNELLSKKPGNELEKKLQDYVEQVVKEVKNDGAAKSVGIKSRALTERLINEYYLPSLYESRNRSNVALDRISEQLTKDPQNIELQQYQAAIKSQVEHFDSLVALPFALQKFIDTLGKNQGRNYTPRENAQVLASLLNTVQKTQEGLSGESLVKALKIAAKITMPDLPADAITLETVKDLLPYVNNVLDKGKALELQKDKIFPSDDEAKSNARKALFQTMGVQFEPASSSINNLVVNTLYKPIEDALQSTGAAYETISSLATEDSIDYLKVIRLAGQTEGIVSNVASGLGYLGAYHDLKDKVSEKAGQASAIAGKVVSAGRQVAGVASYAMGGIGSAISWVTPDRVKAAVGTVANAAMATAEAVTDKAVAAAKYVAPTVGTIASTVGYYTPHAAVSRFVPTPVLAFIPMTKQTILSGAKMVADAAAPYVPASIKDKWAPQTEPSLFWKSLHANGEKEAKKIEAYLSFNELVSASASPSLEDVFFRSYMSTHDEGGSIPTDYSEYSAFKDSISPEIFQIPLDQQINLFEQATGRERFNVATSIVHRLNKLEKMISESKEVEPFLSELQDATHMQSGDVKLLELQKLYVRPSLEKSIVAFELREFGPLLEKALDMDSQNTRLRDMYSKLKAGQILSNEDLTHLKDVSNASTDMKFTIPEKIVEITQEITPVLKIAAEKAFTPKELSRQTIQSNLDNLAVLNRAISEGLQKQLDACEKLNACAAGPVKSMCDAKIKYLEALQKCNNNLLEEMKPEGKLAEQVRGIVSGESTADMLKMADATTVAKQLMCATWEVALPKDTMVGAGLSEKLLAYALSNNEYMGGLVEAKKEFDKALNDTPPPPEFMEQLGNPISTNLLAVDDLAEKAAATAVQTAIDGGKLAAYYATRGFLTYMYPPSLLLEVTAEVLTYPSVQEKIGNVYGSVTGLVSSVSSMMPSMPSMPSMSSILPVGIANYVNAKLKTLTETQEMLSQMPKKMTESIQGRICSMIHGEVKKVLERKAIDYASADPATRSKMNKNERDAFSGFYLQYRALKKDNPALDKAEFVKQFFKDSLEGKDPAVQEDIIKKCSDEFERLDVSLKLRDQPADGLQNTVDLEKELQFLMGTIDFNAPDETALVTLTLYNRLVMMQLEAAKQLPADEALKLQQKAMGTIDSVLQRLEAADALNPPNPDNPRAQTRAEAIVPATRLAAKITLTELQKQLATVSTLIETGIKDREDQLKADATTTEPSRLGVSVATEQYNKATKVNLAYKVGSAVARVATPLAFWGTLGLAIASKGVLPAVLTALGVAGTAAAGVATGGLAVIGALVAARVAYTTAKEVRARDSEFRKISESDASPLKKFGLKVLTGLKCFGIGLAKAVMIDTVYAKVAGLFSRGIKPIVDEVKNVRDLARVNPTRDVLDTEKQALDGVQAKLKELKGLVDAQIKDKEAFGYDATKPDPSKFKLQGSYEKSVAMHKAVDERAEKIEKLTQELAKDLEDIPAFLKQSSGDDSRWVGGAYKELDDYKVAFQKLNGLMEQVNLVKKTELKMRPEMFAQEKVAVVSAEAAKQHLGQAAEIAKAFHGARGMELVRGLREAGSSDERKAMAADIKAKVDSISEEAKRVLEYAKAAEIAAKESGEVGASALTSIKGPASVARDEARKALEYAESIRVSAEQFLRGINKEIAKQEERELDELEDRVFAAMKEDEDLEDEEQDLNSEILDGPIEPPLEALEVFDQNVSLEELSDGAIEVEPIQIVQQKRSHSDTSFDSGLVEDEISNPDSLDDELEVDSDDDKFEDAVDTDVIPEVRIQTSQFKGKLQATIQPDPKKEEFFDAEDGESHEDIIQP